jgi:hypothetical protein
MSCDVALSAAILLASFSPAQSPARPVIPAVATKAANPLAAEPLFATIVGKASALHRAVESFRKASGPLPKPEAFRAEIEALAALDMKGHLELAARGTDGDLKCILKGIAQDLPLKLADLMAAKDAPGRETALRDMAYLLNDNVEVITAPPAPPV